jgi:hypothetical protein
MCVEAERDVVEFVFLKRKNWDPNVVLPGRSSHRQRDHPGHRKRMRRTLKHLHSFHRVPERANTRRTAKITHRTGYTQVTRRFNRPGERTVWKQSPGHRVMARYRERNLHKRARRPARKRKGEEGERRRSTARPLPKVPGTPPPPPENGPDRERGKRASS